MHSAIHVHAWEELTDDLVPTESLAIGKFLFPLWHFISLNCYKISEWTGNVPSHAVACFFQMPAQMVLKPRSGKHEVLGS